MLASHRLIIQAPGRAFNQLGDCYTQSQSYTAICEAQQHRHTSPDQHCNVDSKTTGKQAACRPVLMANAIAMLQLQHVLAPGSSEQTLIQACLAN
ncbi:hypothetical protein ElyMa_004804400 [Elysia marginata]|uniref:Uncharacterized protein n=1 Tax=Elysia marginata TaxID=1093978 RepID=A0AAV4IJK3_9GAST|nr:hypothetical protein ElyMa_004804400 [Elysia marginata]